MGLETIQRFPFIDYVLSGEGDMIFPRLAQDLLSGKRKLRYPGVSSGNYRDDGGSVASALVNDLDLLPFPTYDDYFASLDKIDYKKHFSPRVLFESSRGCWWGEKHHCTFCGLNGQVMTHRTKSSQRIIQELDYLKNVYPGAEVSVVDNIFDMKLFNDLIPELRNQGKSYSLFYEVKANLKKQQLKEFASVGIHTIQPGIENFSSEVLRLMNKGVTGVQNIQLLKWCLELGISPKWNYLYGFPREKPEDYTLLENIVQDMFHLPPPEVFAPIRIDRFSPNFQYSKEYGFDHLFPYPAYSYVYNTLEKESLERIAYYFDYYSSGKGEGFPYAKELGELIVAWKSGYSTSELFYVDLGEATVVCDTRSNKQTGIYKYSRVAALLFRSTDIAISSSELVNTLTSSFSDTPLPVFQECLEDLLKQGFICYYEGKYLSLTVRLNEQYSPRYDSLKLLYDWMQEHMPRNSDGDFIVQ